MKVTGILIEKFEIEEITDTFKKRNFIVEISDNPEYPQPIQFELQGLRCGLIECYEPGEEIEITFKLKGKPWTNNEGKTFHFNTLWVDTISLTSEGEIGKVGTQNVPHEENEPVDASKVFAEKKNIPF